LVGELVGDCVGDSVGDLVGLLVTAVHPLSTVRSPSHAMQVSTTKSWSS
jgi:hypothetical protein